MLEIQTVHYWIKKIPEYNSEICTNNNNNKWKNNNIRDRILLVPGIKWHFVTTYQNSKHLNDLTLSYVYIFELGIERKQARLKTETVHLNSRYVHKYVQPIALLRKWWQIFCFSRISLLLSRQRAVVSSLITM